MRHSWVLVRTLSAVLLCFMVVAPASAKVSTYSTGFVRWRAAEGGFSAWQLDGVSHAADGTLQFDAATAHAGSDPYAAGGYYGRNFYNGGSFFVGEALGLVTATSFGFFEAISSWNASTPAGTWIESQIRAQVDGRWTKWYNLGIWASDYSTIERHSVRLQGDSDGYVAVDTLVLNDKQPAATA